MARARRAQLIAEAVTVVCPACGADQPAAGNGSLFWTNEDLAKMTGPIPCVSCDVPLIITAEGKVQFS